LAVGIDLPRAAEHAVARALATLDGQRPDLGFVFVCGRDAGEIEQALARAADRLGAGTTLGCSATGVMGGSHGLEGVTSVAVWAAVLPGIRARSFHLEVIRTPESIAVVGMPPHAHDDDVAVVLADPWSFPIDGFVEQSNAQFPGLPFVGGLAGSGGGSGTTRLMVDGRVVDRGAVGVCLGAAAMSDDEASGMTGRPSFGVRTVMSQGCRPIGPLMTVTKVESNAILELAGCPALDKLQAVVAGLSANDQALATRGVHLGIVIDEYSDRADQGDFLVRALIGAEREHRALVLADVVEVGRTVQFQVRDAVAADEDLVIELGEFLRRREFAAVEGALVFSGSGRGGALFASASHDVVAVREALNASGVCGFFASGEIGPVGGSNHLHDSTASVLAFGSPFP
jgi:small ligand-binding sensory domain FIST